MKRYYLLASIFCLLSTLGTIAMEQPSVAESKQEVEEVGEDKKETITVEFENEDELEVSLDYLQQCEIFNKMVEFFDHVVPNEWFLSLLSKEDFQIIEPFLSLLAQSSVNDELKKELVKERLTWCSLSDLTALLNIADSLEASLVLEAGVPVYDEEILTEFLKELSLGLKNHTPFFLFKGQLEQLNVPMSAHTKIITYLKEQLHFFKTYEVPITKLKGDGRTISCISFSPNGKHIVSASYKGTVNLWDTETQTWKKTSEDHTGWVTSISFSPDSTKFATASCDGTVRIWNTVSGDCIKTFGSYRAKVKFVSFSPDGAKLAFVVHHPDAHDSRITSSIDIQVWDVAPDSFTRRNTWNPSKTYIDCVSFDSESKHIAYASKDGIILLDIQDSCNEQLVKGDRRANCLSFSLDGKYIAFATKGTLWLYDIGQKVVTQKLPGHFSPISSISFSPDGKHIACASRGGRIKLWDVTTGLCIKKLTGLKTETENSVGFSPDSTQLISSKGGKVMLWNIGDMFSAFDKLTLPQTMLLYMIENGYIKDTDMSADETLNDTFTTLNETVQNQYGRLLKESKPYIPSVKTIISCIGIYNFINKLTGYQKIGS